jgi:uncharacterized protein YdaU (DUF1376 family)
MQGNSRVNGLPYYKAYPRDFFEGTVGMDGDLKGAYRMVLDLIYMHAGNLPDNANYIAGHLGLSIRQWGFHRKRLLALGKLFVRDEFIASSRADQELFATRSYQEQQAFNGSQPKKNKHIPEAKAKPTLSHTEPDTDTERTETKVSVARKRASPKTRIPPEALISEQMRAAAEQQGLSDAEAEAQFAKFRDWALAKGQAYADWNAAWRNWLTSPHFAPVLGAVHKFPNRRQTYGERVDDAFAAAAVLVAQRPFD